MIQAVESTDKAIDRLTEITGMISIEGVIGDMVTIIKIIFNAATKEAVIRDAADIKDEVVIKDKAAIKTEADIIAKVDFRIEAGIKIEEATEVVNVVDIAVVVVVLVGIINRHKLDLTKNFRCLRIFSKPEVDLIG